MMAAKSLKLSQSSVFSMQTELQSRNEWKDGRYDYCEVGKYEFKLRMKGRNGVGCSVVTASSVLERAR